jgi:glucosamine-6-phosphate deaminase
MEVIIQPDPHAVAVEAAKIIAHLIRTKPNAVLGLATGGTPVLLYAELVRMHKDSGLDFREVTTFNLDEYVGIGPQHPSSYAQYMRENLFAQVNLRPDRVHIPDGMARDIPGECAGYEAAIQRAGGIDLQVLGIGVDGHIGFNEPGSSLASRTRIKTLTERTLQQNARYFPDPKEIPHHVITMGVGTIMEARHCLLLATGDPKSAVVAQFVEGPVTATVPASILQMHPRATVILDEAAAANLRRQSYYRWVYDNKPAWQRV